MHEKLTFTAARKIHIFPHASFNLDKVTKQSTELVTIRVHSSKLFRMIVQNDVEARDTERRAVTHETVLSGRAAGPIPSAAPAGAGGRSQSAPPPRRPAAVARPAPVTS